jgi:DNA-binding GntR family transcriptional regulator
VYTKYNTPGSGNAHQVKALSVGSKFTVVPTTRLRDQVYNIFHEELKTGTLKPGERLNELALAKRYRVSRTPVREALFQLAREGLLVSDERSFRLPTDTPQDLRDRIEVHMLIDPAVASHAATEGTDRQIAALTKFHEAEKQAERAGKFEPFVQANYQFAKTLRSMCRNAMLARCSGLLQDQFVFARSNLFRVAENRAIAARHDGKVLKAVQARDAKGARQAMIDYMTELAERF